MCSGRDACGSRVRLLLSRCALPANPLPDPSGVTLGAGSLDLFCTLRLIAQPVKPLLVKKISWSRSARRRAAMPTNVPDLKKKRSLNVESDEAKGWRCNIAQLPSRGRSARFDCGARGRSEGGSGKAGPGVSFTLFTRSFPFSTPARSDTTARFHRVLIVRSMYLKNIFLTYRRFE